MKRTRRPDGKRRRRRRRGKRRTKEKKDGESGGRGAANESDNSVCRAQAAWNAASNRVPAFINLFPPAFLLPASFYRLTICFTGPPRTNFGNRVPFWSSVMCSNVCTLVLEIKVWFRLWFLLLFRFDRGLWLWTPYGDNLTWSFVFEVSCVNLRIDVASRWIRKNYIIDKVQSFLRCSRLAQFFRVGYEYDTNSRVFWLDFNFLCFYFY